MGDKIIICLAIFAISILFTSTVSTSPLFTEVDAIQAKTNYKHEINSKKVCGIDLCASGQTPTTPKGVTILPDSASYENPDAEMLFVQTAPSGTFEIKDGRQILTLSEISPTTIYFSDRPDRIAGFLATELFFALWGEGENSFASNPPNAALELFDANDHSDVFILELTNPMFSPESEILQYDVIILEEALDGLTQYSKRNFDTIPATFEHSVLFIDSFGSWMKNAGEKSFVDPAKSIISAPDSIRDSVNPSHKDLSADSLLAKIKGDIQTNIKKSFKKVNYGNWEGDASEYLTLVINNAASAGGTAGEKIGGEKGKTIGTAIGAEMGKTAAKTTIKILTSTDIGDMSASDNFDAASLSDVLKKSMLNGMSNYLIAESLSEKIFESQNKNIENKLLGFVHGFKNIPAYDAAYQENLFCGTTNDQYVKNILLKDVMVSFKHTLTSIILEDLNNGIPIDEIKSSVAKKITPKITTIILNSLLHIQDDCQNDAGLAKLLYDTINNKIDKKSVQPSIVPSTVTSIVPLGFTFIFAYGSMDEAPTAEVPEAPTAEAPQPPTSEPASPPTAEVPEAPTAEAPQPPTSEPASPPTAEVPEAPTAEAPVPEAPIPEAPVPEVTIPEVTIPEITIPEMPELSIPEPPTIDFSMPEFSSSGFSSSGSASDVGSLSSIDSIFDTVGYTGDEIGKTIIDELSDKIKEYSANPESFTEALVSDSFGEYLTEEMSQDLTDDMTDAAIEEMATESLEDVIIE